MSYKIQKTIYGRFNYWLTYKNGIELWNGLIDNGNVFTKEAADRIVNKLTTKKTIVENFSIVPFI